MTKFVILYKGPKGTGDTAVEQQTLVDAWNTWYTILGDRIVDGGHPFGESRAIGPDGAELPSEQANLTGYTIITAEGLDEATHLAKGCPVLKSHGRVEVYEALAF